MILTLRHSFVASLRRFMSLAERNLFYGGHYLIGDFLLLIIEKKAGFIVLTLIIGFFFAGEDRVEVKF